MRLARGWTLEETAERADLDVRHVQQIEAGKGNPTTLTLLRLCRGLRVSVVEMLGASDQGSAPRPYPPIPAETLMFLADVSGAASRRPKIQQDATLASSDEACSTNVRRLRIARDWSQSELAHRAGLSQGAIQSIEAGTKCPSLRTLDLVAAALGVDP
jgi:transcriptional regulator with XRE-family HTH domain